MLTESLWTTEFSRSFKNLGELYHFLDWEAPVGLEKVTQTYPVFIPRRLAQKIKDQGTDGVLARQFLPSHLELDEKLNSIGLLDPIGDKNFNKAPQLIHRYPSRVLFTATNICPVHCRYCFRKNELDAQDELFQKEFSRTISYLREHPEVTEIIFTGGDPFTLSNEKIRKYLDAFASIPSLLDIRFHTRYPVIFPERIDSALIQLLSDAAKRFRTVSVAIHTNHTSEFDEDSEVAITSLAKAPLQLLSQTVLLKGVNDSLEELLKLFNLFLKVKIRPYYLHHPDHVKGGMHFYTSLEDGRNLYSSLRKHLPGWAIPHYVIDVPGGHGKISAFNPETSTFSGHFLSLNGEEIALQEPDFFI